MTKSVQLISPFSVDEFGLSTQSPPYIQIGINGSDAFTIDSGNFFTFISGSGTIEQIDYPCFLQWFVDYLALNGYGTWTYSYDFETQVLTLDGGVNTATFTFDSTSQLLLGMDSSAIPKSLYTSTRIPYYVWKSTEYDWQLNTWQYENSKVATETETDDGRVFQLSNEDDLTWLSDLPLNVKFVDWEHHWEPQENVYIAHSSSNNPYVFQQHIQHVRSYKPFLVYRNCTTSSIAYSDRMGTYKIRSPQSNFKPVVSNKNLDSFWNIPVNTRQLSLGTNFGTYNPTTANQLFDPTSIPDCLIWLRADMGITLNGATTQVKVWADQSGNGNNFLSTSVSTSPALFVTYSNFNNQNAIFFDGTTDRLTSSISNNFNSAPAATIFVPWRQVGNLGSMQKIFSGPSQSSNIFQLGISSSNGLIMTYKSGSSTETVFSASNKTITANTNYIGQFNYNFYVSNSFASGKVYETDSSNLTIFSGSYSNGLNSAGILVNSSSQYRLGQSANNTEWFNGYIPEFIFYNRELTDSESTQVMDYLLERYGF